MDKIHNSKLSTEILSAYIDNNLSSQDMEIVTNAINDNPELMDLCVINDIVKDEVAENNHEELPIDLVTDNFSIPTFEELLSSDNNKAGVYETIIDDSLSNIWGDSSENISENFNITDISNDDLGTKSINDKNHLDMENKDLLNVGYKANENQETFDPKIYQGFNPSCAVCSQDIILKDFGIKISREELIKFATEQGWYDPDPKRGGTPKECVGNILDACGIETTRYENACFGDIVRELSAGHRVIVSVDADELWINKEEGMYKHLFGEVKNKLNDAMDNALGREGANHALVVAGININPKDPNDVRVVLIDSGSGDYCIEYSWKQFSDALADSHNYVVATKEAAPYQYNYQTEQFEPSGFDSNFIPSMAHIPEGLHNNFSLPESYYNAFEDFTPFFDHNHILSLDGFLHGGKNVASSLEENDKSNQEDSDDTNEEGDYDESNECDDDTINDNNDDIDDDNSEYELEENEDEDDLETTDTSCDTELESDDEF